MRCAVVPLGLRGELRSVALGTCVCAEQVAKIKAHIKLVTEGIHELKALSKEASSA